jgi:hypothetical protein
MYAASAQQSAAAVNPSVDKELLKLMREGRNRRYAI